MWWHAILKRTVHTMYLETSQLLSVPVWQSEEIVHNTGHQQAETRC